MGRRCIFDQVTAALFPAIFKTLGAESVFAHGNQLRHKQSHHPVEEPTRLNLHTEQISTPLNVDLLYCCSGMRSATSRPHESTEVMQPEHAY